MYVQQQSTFGDDKICANIINISRYEQQFIIVNVVNRRNKFIEGDHVYCNFLRQSENAAVSSS